jgi:hypothetical protein
MPRRPKIDLPADLTAPYVAPEDASVEELTAMIEQTRADANALLAEGAKGSIRENVAKANWYADAIAAMETRQDTIVADSVAEQAELDAARAKLAPKADDAGGSNGIESDEEKAAREAREKEEAEASAKAQAEGNGVQIAGDPAAQAPLAEPLLVAGAGRRSAVAAAAVAGRPPAIRQRPVPRGDAQAHLVASTSVGNVAEMGQRIDFDQLGVIAEKRFSSLPQREGGQPAHLPLGKVIIPTNDERLVASAASGEGFVDISAQIEWACSMDRLKEETGEDTLTAAGGWCSPSETLYDLVNKMTRDGILDVPSMTVVRGGVRYTLGPDFTAVYNSGQNFTKTEAQAIAGSVKPIVNVPCPAFTDNRLLVDGLYLTGDILSQKGYPEAYADYLEKSLIAFDHYVNAAAIADQVALSTAVDFTAVHGANLSVTSTLLGSLELEVTDVRYKNRLSLTEMVEVVLPHFAKGILRSDLAKRLGVENGQGISDAEIESYLTVRGANVQWVYDWQDAFTGVSGGFGAATPPTAWPANLFYLVYPQGTFVKAQSDVIELSAVYDSTLLTTNQFVLLFMERSRLTLKRIWDARYVKVPVVISGTTALGVDYTLSANQPTI